MNQTFNAQAYVPTPVAGKHNLEGIDLNNCINVAEVHALLKDPSNADIFTPMQSRLIGAFNIVGKNGDLGRTLEDFAIKNSSILCDMSVRDNIGASAYYESKDHFIALRTLNDNGSKISSSDMVTTILEEVGHNYQDVALDSLDEMREGNYLPQHKILSYMAVEAQMKLSIARQGAINTFEGGDPDLIVATMNGDGAIQKMTKSFIRGGPASVNDPQVLMNGFNKFFEDKRLVDAYIKFFENESVKWPAGTEEITQADFTEKYGFAIGSDVNFMATQTVDASYLEKLIEKTSPEAFATYKQIGVSTAISPKSELNDTPAPTNH